MGILRCFDSKKGTPTCTFSAIKGERNSLWWEALVPLADFKPGGEEQSVEVPAGVQRQS